MTHNYVFILVRHRGPEFVVTRERDRPIGKRFPPGWALLTPLAGGTTVLFDDKNTYITGSGYGSRGRCRMRALAARGSTTAQFHRGASWKWTGIDTRMTPVNAPTLTRSCDLSSSSTRWSAGASCGLDPVS